MKIFSEDTDSQNVPEDTQNEGTKFKEIGDNKTEGDSRYNAIIHAEDLEAQKELENIKEQYNQIEKDELYKESSKGSAPAVNNQDIELDIGNQQIVHTTKSTWQKILESLVNFNFLDVALDVILNTPLFDKKSTKNGFWMRYLAKERERKKEYEAILSKTDNIRHNKDIIRTTVRLRVINAMVNMATFLSLNDTVQRIQNSTLDSISSSRSSNVERPQPSALQDATKEKNVQDSSKLSVQEKVKASAKDVFQEQQRKLDDSKVVNEKTVIEQRASRNVHSVADINKANMVRVSVEAQRSDLNSPYVRNNNFYYHAGAMMTAPVNVLQFNDVPQPNLSRDTVTVIDRATSSVVNYIKTFVSQTINTIKEVAKGVASAVVPTTRDTTFVNSKATYTPRNNSNAPNNQNIFNMFGRGGGDFVMTLNVMMNVLNLMNQDNMLQVGTVRLAEFTVIPNQMNRTTADSLISKEQREQDQSQEQSFISQFV